MQAEQTTIAKPRRKREEANKSFANDGSFDSVDRLLWKLATRCFARAQAMGLGMTFDDVRQEMNVSYLLAKNTWSPERGVLFSTYMTTCCYRNFNELMRRAGMERKHLGMVNMTDMKPRSDQGDDDYDVMEYMDTGVELNVVGLYGDLLLEGSISGELEAPMNADPAVLREEAHDALERRAASIAKLEVMTSNAKSVLLELFRAFHRREDCNDRLPRFGQLLQARGYSKYECTRIRKEIANAFGVKVI